MHTIRRHLSYANIVSSACLFLLLGGVAWAAIGTGGPPIHACYSKSTGALRIASHCKRSEKTLVWNKLGAQGLDGRNGVNGKNGSNGANGQNGATGATGPAGPSDVYADGKATGALTETFASYGEVTLPAGSYMLTGSTTFFSKKDGSELFCELAGDSTGVPEFMGADATAGNTLAQEVSLSAVQTFAASQTVAIVCRLQPGGEGTLDNPHVIATKTESLHGTTPRD
jgi:hypothetical protein